jgi:prepilin signal peptidase PulO-like enzyme (type II secretory pathway)
MTDPFLPVIVFLALLLGLLWGSFLNVCIYRLPRRETIVHGHSYCPNCRHLLGGADLIPVLSFVFLRGRCRYCREPIAPRYARVELLTAAYFTLVTLLWQPQRLGPASEPILAWLDIWTAAAPYLLILSAAATFCALLVWAMILFDRQRPPWGLYGFIGAPVVLRLLLQPHRLLPHLLAVLAAGIFCLVVYLLRLVPTDEARLHQAAGLLLLALAAGLSAAQPVLGVCLAILLILALNRQQKSQSKRVRVLLRSMPLIALLIGSVAWLFF